jgi:hypothetical protein
MSDHIYGVEAVNALRAERDQLIADYDWRRRALVTIQVEDGGMSQAHTTATTALLDEQVESACKDAE